MSVIIDPYKSYAQKYYNNDSIVIPLTLRNLSYVPVKPLIMPYSLQLLSNLQD
ncbi:MAG: hypothetical protein R3A12_04430 [Ignavibacteria bacterium]